MMRFSLLFHTKWLARRGSITLLAFIVLAVMFVVGMAFNTSAQNNILMIYRFKIEEQGLAIGDGMIDLAKRVAEEQANSDGVVKELIEELAKGKADSSGERELFNVRNCVYSGNALKAAFDALCAQVEGGKPLLFDAVAKVKLQKDKDGFPKRTGYVNVAEEFKGTIFLSIEYSMVIYTEKMTGKEGKPIKSNPRVLSTQFEFKRNRIQPPAVRHFTMFAQDATQQPEKPGEYNKMEGTYNTLLVDADGNAKGQAPNYLVFNNGAKLPPNALASLETNPFKNQLGYVLLGTGGGDDEKKGIYLNLTAGSGPASETFHLFRGEQGESDFYTLYTDDYSTLLDKSTKIESSIDSARQIESVKRYLADQGQKTGGDQGLAYYYLARKDFGYAEDWGGYPEFGFVPPDKSSKEKIVIPANKMHIFGTQSKEQASPTVVFGNVFRRCLSLSGFKQIRAENKGNTSDGKKQMEVQAGPIYYYRDYEQLHNHKLYTPINYGEEIRNNDDFSPIKIWDARMNWIWDSKKPDQPALKGAWVVVSGDGLMGRLVPAIGDVFKKAGGPELFKVTVAAPGNDFYDKVWNEAEKPSGSSGVYVAPMLRQLFDKEKGWPELFEAADKRLKWKDDEKYSAYFKEILLMFYFNCGTAYQALGKKPEEWASDNTYEEMVKKGAERWLEIMKMVNDLKEEGNKRYGMKKMGMKFWDQSKTEYYAKWNKDGEDKEKTPIMYFTLPDPWEMLYPKDQKGLFAGAKAGESNAADAVKETALNKVLQSRSSSGTSDREDDGPQGLFKNYFRKLMTDPAWVLPYNYSSRFFFDDFRRMYFTKEPSGRKKFMGELASPEFRDSIGYSDSSINPYMDPKGLGNGNSPLNTKAQSKILKEYANGKKPKKPGYFFAAELEGNPESLETLDLQNLYDGRCAFQYKDQASFKAEFVRGDTLDLGTTVCINGGLSLGTGKSSLAVKKGGVIVVRGELEIKGSLSGEKLVLFAKNIKAPRADITASLIQTTVGQGGFDYRIKNLKGNLVVKKLGKMEIDGQANLEYDYAFLKADDYLVSFQPYIKAWGQAAGK